MKGNRKAAKFAMMVSVATSTVIGLFFWFLILIFHNDLALIFFSSKPVLEAGLLSDRDGNLTLPTLIWAVTI
ncbi:unnamed protein product [Thlaspi arvense]|uniref:Uncharacterized protein n=1 Tax=Thlaspi arvense TaxID=13288 RepID=A0AAU9RUN6_THLAR|nr:unnamed protein product [Thlaspi arvense]